MHIHAIHVDHFLSFDTFTWERLDPHLNVIVGPNGVGKTNLFQALRVVCDTLSLEPAQAHARWAGTRHRGRDADSTTIVLDIEFTTAWEKHLLCTSLAAVLCDRQQIQQIVGSVAQLNLDDNRIKQFAAWVNEHLHPADISWLFRGTLTVTRAGRNEWQCHYGSSPEAPRFRIDLNHGGMLFGNAEHSVQATKQNSGSLFAAWRTSLSDEARQRLDNGLTGAAPERVFPVPDFSRLPDWVSSQVGVGLQIGSNQQYVDLETLATYRAFAAAAHLSSEEQRGGFGMRLVFQRLLEQALVFTDNVRVPPQGVFTSTGLFESPLDLSSGKQLARFLFRKKNGDSRDRKQYEAIEGLFSRMTRRQFDVVVGTVNAGGVPPSQLGTEAGQQEQPNISLALVTSGQWDDIPLQFSGAGIAEALYLSAVVAGSIGQVVVLDEPALNLHPTMQATLLSEVLKLAHQPEEELRSQFLVNTHTPTLVPPDAIDSISRFTLEEEKHTIRQALNDGKIEAGILNDLRKMLRGNLAARALLFSRAVILVEGDTERAALPVWCSDVTQQDILLYEVSGKGNFVSILKLVQHFDIPWAIIGDGDLLWDRHQAGPRADHTIYIRTILAACNQPFPTPPGDPGMNPDDFAQWRQTLEAYGIFTLAGKAFEAFERAIQPEISGKLWSSAEAEFGSDKVAFARFIAENHERPQKVEKLIWRVLSYLRTQRVDNTLPDEDGQQTSTTHSESQSPQLP